jgi:hypothetical protein
MRLKDENMIDDRPFDNSYWVLPKKLLAGHFPGDLEPEIARKKLQRLLDVGVTAVINLMEEDEVDYFGRPFVPYWDLLKELSAGKGKTIRWIRFPIPDMNVPTSLEMKAILDTLDELLNEGRVIYIHCWGGVGRTGTVVGCFLARHRIASGNQALKTIRNLRDAAGLYILSPETFEQCDFIRQWPEGK